MAYRILAEESAQEAVRRMALEQIDNAVREIDDQQLDRHEAVHQVRKRCKKIRGLVRLVRPQFEDTYSRENAWFRDSAATLSYVRDAQSIIETFDKLIDHYQGQIASEAFSAVRRQLTDRRKRVAEDEVGLRERLDEFRARMQEGRERVAKWQLRDRGFDALEGGLTKTYARGRSAMARAYKKPDAENFHEWRKRAKYHWYHMRLLQPMWKGPMKERRDEVHLLSDYLGDDHDLSILRDTVTDQPDQFGEEDTIQAMTGLIVQQQAGLRTKAHPLGRRVFAEKPKRFAKRLRRYWDSWRSEVESEPQLAAGPGSTFAQ